MGCATLMHCMNVNQLLEDFMNVPSTHCRHAGGHCSNTVIIVLLGSSVVTSTVSKSGHISQHMKLEQGFETFNFHCIGQFTCTVVDDSALLYCILVARDIRLSLT